MFYIIEIATSDFETTKAAVKGGADRIELCANLDEGGTTASYGTIYQCRESFDVLIYPIIRPRGGDFLYSDDEYEIILHDVKLCKQLGCDGIVIGLLNADGTIDVKRTAAIIEIAYPMGVTFHRAFDRCRDPFEAMEQLIQIGCERILTSGQKPGAPDGIELIAQLNQKADHRIVIMPGSGVRKENIKTLAEKTGCTEFHSSLRNKTKSKMEFIHPSFENSSESYMNNSIDPAEVAALRNALSN
ncbi:MAG TPA: copper homeostasis protein CutC [Chitinophagaceae bacterium]|jgi:copper homeostasis protein|nr:copper homeostasis protein CutC [Chitinophagaceae bacterium]